MKKLTITCDICGEECHERRHGEVAGCIMKMGSDGNTQEMVFVGQYCENDIQKIIRLIQGLKNEQTGDTDTGTEPDKQGDAGGNN